MKKKYKILITNDDGLFSFGLIPLVKELSKLGELCVIIPEKEMSAISHSLTLFSPVRVKEIKFDRFKIKLVSGTPADCVRLGIIEFQKKQTDIVISGINQGPNLGQDVNYSGTVAAAREAVFLNTTGVAISTNGTNYELISKISRKIIEKILKTNLGKPLLLNINFPKNKPKGIQITSLGDRRYKEMVHKKIDPVGVPYYWLKSKLVCNVVQNNVSDVVAVTKGYISITPLTYDITDYKNLHEVKKIFSDFNI